MKLTFHADPSHGWLKVTPEQLKQVSLAPADFSTYSYRSAGGQFYYLEEDCDAPKFLNACKANNITPVITHYNTNSSSFIRILESIR